MFLLEATANPTGVASALASATTSPLATSDSGAQNIGQWFDDFLTRAPSLGAAFVLLVVCWLVGRYAIKVFTAGIERGAAISDSKTIAALRKAKIRIPQRDDTEARLEAERRRQRAHTLRRVLNAALAVVMIVVIAMLILAVVGVPIGPMLASAGIFGVALGFGAQSLVKDILTGVFMLIEDQYGVGDVVDLGAASGSVEEVGLRCTRLRALDGTVWYVPNGEVVRVGNMTRMWSRVMIEVRFAYDTDVEDARNAMIDAVKAAAADSEMVASSLLDEAEVAGIESLEYNAVMLRLMCQVNPATQWDVQREVRREMRRIFAERGLRLAVPGEAMVVDARPLHAPSTAAPDSPRVPGAEQPLSGNGKPLPPDASDIEGEAQ